MVRQGRSESTTGSPSNRQASPPSEPREVAWKERICHFTWTWFECTMATGAMAVLLAQQPFKFDGLFTIGRVFFILDLVLFVSFSACIATRFAMQPGSLKLSLHHPRESFFFGTFWVSIAFIIYNIELYGAPYCGFWLVRTLEVLFWGYAGCALLVVIFQYHVIFDTRSLPVADATPAWLLPAYPFLVLGPLAAGLEHSQPAGSGLPIMIGGLAFAGFGWSMAFMMYTLYLTRLINSEMPAETERPGMYVAVGPAAYTSSTFMAVGSLAPKILPAGFLGTEGTSAGQVWKAVGLPAGVFLWLLGFWFFALASISNVLGWKKMKFTMSCWSFVFPQAGLTIAAIQLGTELDSDGIKAVTSAMTILVGVAWLGVAAASIRAVCTKEVLWPGADEDAEEVEHERRRE
ncbi:malic acid transporter [Diplodia corticola]|uniref:Malic acid transporter n=1 Tax=Diplodia corticola TaxID=236234 RepID=A0A1J9S271_9PEZI|nr:malic acid transporter [Diplodia corticola]OJD34671.1 malic acid transporter [Diplodia corticola]